MPAPTQIIDKIENDNIVFTADYFYPVYFVDKETLRCIEKYETEDGSISYKIGALTDSLTTEELIDRLDIRFLEADENTDKIEIPIEELLHEINSVKGRLLLDSRVFSRNLQREMYFIELFSHVVGGDLKDYCMQFWDNKIVLSEDEGDCVDTETEMVDAEGVDIQWLVGNEWICDSTDCLLEAIRTNGLHEVVIEVSCEDATVALYQILGSDKNNYRVIRLTNGVECVTDVDINLHVSMIVDAAFEGQSF